MRIGNELKAVLPVSMLSYFFVSCWTFLIPLMQRQLGFLYAEIGMVVSISILASLFCRPFLGHLADRFGTTFILKLSIFGLTLSNVIVFFSFNVLSFIVASTIYLVSKAMVYWTSMLVINSSRRQISLWLSLNSFGGFIGFVVATAISTFFDPRLVFGLLFFLPLLALRVRDVKVKRRKATSGRVTTGLLVLSAAGFFMVFHVAMWSSFFPIYLNSFLPKMQSFLSTGLFLACDSLLFTFVFYISGKVSTKTRGAAMVAATTLVFTSIVSAIPLLPLAPFLLAFLVFRNVVIAFRMIGVAEMVRRRGFSNFQTQFYSTFANSALIFAPLLGGIVSDSFGLDCIFYLSAPFGLISSLLFLL